MAEETTRARRTEHLESELVQSRERAARLMDNLARKIGASRPVRSATNGMHRAARYVQSSEWRSLPAEITKAVRGRPATSILVAAVAGFLIGRALRPR